MYFMFSDLSADTYAHQKRASDPTRQLQTTVTDVCEMLHGYWELNSRPLEIKQCYLTTESSLHPCNLYFNTNILIEVLNSNHAIFQGVLYFIALILNILCLFFRGHSVRVCSDRRTSCSCHPHPPRPILKTEFRWTMSAARASTTNLVGSFISYFQLY